VNTCGGIIENRSTVCLKKTGPLLLISHNFINSQYLLFLVGIDLDLIQFYIYYVKKFLNWLRTSCAVSVTTVATAGCVSFITVSIIGWSKSAQKFAVRVSYNNKLRMQSLREQGLGAKAIIFSYPDKRWKLSTVKKVCSRVDRTGSAVLRKPGSVEWRPATATSACGVCRCKTAFPLVGPGIPSFKRMSLKR